MPVQPNEDLFSLWGTVIWGDFAELTLYRRPDGRVVTFAKTYPDKPPTPDQLAQRQLIIDAAAAWQALPQNKKDAWQAMARQASLCMHGYDLYVHYNIKQDTAVIETLQCQTGVTVLP